MEVRLAFVFITTVNAVPEYASAECEAYELSFIEASNSRIKLKKNVISDSIKNSIDAWQADISNYFFSPPKTDADCIAAKAKLVDVTNKIIKVDFSPPVINPNSGGNYSGNLGVSSCCGSRVF